MKKYRVKRDLRGLAVQMQYGSRKAIYPDPALRDFRSLCYPMRKISLFLSLLTLAATAGFR